MISSPLFSFFSDTLSLCDSIERLWSLTNATSGDCQKAVIFLAVWSRGLQMGMSSLTCLWRIGT